MEGVFLHNKLFLGQLRVFFPFLPGDAPLFCQIGSKHVLHRHIGQSKGGSMIGNGLYIQRIVLKQESSLLHRLPEPAADLRVAGIRNVGH